jgi:hypothetical protein
MQRRTWKEWRGKAAKRSEVYITRSGASEKVDFYDRRAPHIYCSASALMTRNYNVNSEPNIPSQRVRED